MKNRFLCVVGVLCVLCSAPLAAQETEGYPAAERGGRSIVLEASGSPRIGYWTRRSTRTDLGLDVMLQGLLGDSQTDLSIGVTPAMKRYLSSPGPLAPYIYAGVPLNYHRFERDNVGVPDDTSDAFGVGGIAGFGLDWYPIPQLSLGGHAGLRAGYLNRGDDAGSSIQLGTLSSGVRMHLYF